MPCLRNLTISHALQYFDDDIRKKEAKGLDYYSQEDGGVWFGKTAEELGFIDKKFNTRVILQGDEKQLDSVEGETLFHRLINNKHVE